MPYLLISEQHICSNRHHVRQCNWVPILKDWKGTGRYSYFVVNKPQAVRESMFGLIHCHHADRLASGLSQIGCLIVVIDLLLACFTLIIYPLMIVCFTTIAFSMGVLVHLVGLAQKLHSRWSYGIGFLLLFLDGGTIAVNFFCPVPHYCLMFVSLDDALAVLRFFGKEKKSRHC